MAFVEGVSEMKEDERRGKVVNEMTEAVFVSEVRERRVKVVHRLIELRSKLRLRRGCRVVGVPTL